MRHILVGLLFLPTIESDLIEDKIDGLLMFELEHRISKYKTLFSACYVPLENSIWNNRDEIFETITTYIYSRIDLDSIIVLGDFNARPGVKNDFIPIVDNLPVRLCLDDTCNKQGEEFLSFIKDNKLGIAKGRFGVNSNKYTCIKNNGNSVVDYFACDHNILKSVKNVEVITPDEVLDLKGLK